MDYTLRTATPADVAFLVALEEDAYRAHIEALGLAWEPSRNESNVRTALDSGSLALVVCGGAPVGSLEVDWKADPVFLGSIELIAAARGRGLGTRIVKDVLRKATESGRDVGLQVLRPNRARGLYERLGFEPVSTTETHVSMVWRRTEHRPRG